MPDCVYSTGQKGQSFPEKWSPQDLKPRIDEGLQTCVWWNNFVCRCSKQPAKSKRNIPFAEPATAVQRLTTASLPYLPCDPVLPVPANSDPYFLSISAEQGNTFPSGKCACEKLTVAACLRELGTV